MCALPHLGLQQKPGSSGVQALRPISSACLPLQCYRRAARGAAGKMWPTADIYECPALYHQTNPPTSCVNTRSNITDKNNRYVWRNIVWKTENQVSSVLGRSARHFVKVPLQRTAGGFYSPRGGGVQFTDLVLGVLAQFPESPDGCHCDRLRGEEKRREETRRDAAADYDTREAPPALTEGRLWAGRWEGRL